MGRDEISELDPEITNALDELQTLIRHRYPDAQFEIVRETNDPPAIHLIATIDAENPDDVVDIVIDRLLELQVDARLPIHVIPILPLNRLATQKELSLSNPQALLPEMPQG